MIRASNGADEAHPKQGPEKTRAVDKGTLNKGQSDEAQSNTDQDLGVSAIASRCGLPHSVQENHQDRNQKEAENSKIHERRKRGVVRMRNWRLIETIDQWLGQAEKAFEAMTKREPFGPHRPNASPDESSARQSDVTSKYSDQRFKADSQRDK